MTLISLICLLALSSSAFGRSSYGSYSAPEPTRDWNSQQRSVLPQIPSINQVQSNYGQQSNGYSSGSFGLEGEQKLNTISSRTVLPVSESTPIQQWSNAESQCRGQRAGTIIPLDNGRRWVTCLDEEKAVEQACPRNLFYNLESRRCERRAGQLENPCISQPCLNNGQCVAIDSSSFECKCAPGFDGTLCELDARVCQTQQPCGQAQGTRCQSFRSGAALQHVCIHQNELAYGFSAQQVQSSPCKNVDGTHPLAISDKGFIMCDGERMFVESCPGGTIWDDVNKACVWPDMQGFFGSSRPTEPVKDYSINQQKSIPTSSFGAPALPQQRSSESISSYGQVPMQRSFEPISSFGQIPTQRSSEPISSFGQTSMQRSSEPISSFGQTSMQRSSEPISSFGQTSMQRSSEPISSFGQTSMQRSSEPMTNFGQIPTQRSSEPISSFSQTPMQRSSEPMTNFGQIPMQRSSEPISSFGQTSMQRSSEPVSSFGQVPMQRSSEPMTNFGQVPMQRSFESTNNLASQQSSFGIPQTLPKSLDLSVQQPIQKPQEFFPVQPTPSSFGNQQQWSKPADIRPFQQSSSY